MEFLTKNKAYGATAALLVLIALVLDIYSRQCGLILTSDSEQYLSSAKSFKTDGIFLSPDGSYYSHWPPLFPMLLSLFSNPYEALNWINLLLKIAISGCLLLLAETFLTKTFYKITFFTVTLLSVQVVMISTFLWSELLFLLLLLLSVYCCLRIKEEKKFYILLLALGFLLCLQRNAGFFCISAITLWLLLDRSEMFSKRLLRCGAFFFISISGLIVWNIYQAFYVPQDEYNLLRIGFFRGFFSNVWLLAGAFSKVFIPFDSNLVIFSFVCLVIASMVFLMKPISQSRAVQLMLLLIIFYFTGFCCLGVLDHYEVDRYIAPILPLVFLLAILFIETISKRNVPAMKVVAITMLFLFVTYSLARTAKNASLWHQRSCSAVSFK